MAEKILIVDDELDTLRLIGMMLERQGYQILAANGGAQALAMAKKEKPDLILLDLMMPDIDGIEVTRQLRADPSTQNILIIMFTAKAQTDDKLVGFEAGADDYLTKPAQPRELLAHVRAVLNRAQRGAASGPKRALGARGKTIAVTSAKGGVGVTTVAINLGIALTTQYRKEVIVADFRPGQGSLGLDLGYTNSQGLNHLLSTPLSQLTAGNVEAELLAYSQNLRLLLASSFPQDARYLNAVDYFSTIADHLAHLAQVTVLDLGSGVTPINEQILPNCEQVVIVLEPVAQNIAQTRSYVEYLNQLGLQGNRVLLVLVNRIRAGVQLSLGQVQDQLKHPVNAIFTAAPELAYQASVENTPLLLAQGEGITAKQFITLAELVERQLR